MLKHRLYYALKPFLPWRVRNALRRISARSILRRSVHTWPVNPASARAPTGWKGWPDKKQFAVVLTHDVEDQIGLNRCEALAQLDKSLGFRSSFNFVPEGGYRTPPRLRHWLVQNGFEVGVHDLRHDGKLYHSRRGFSRKAQSINSYIREWGAAGFRSGFMLHQLDWLHDLDIEYDASTFDTDPFEPQPDCVNTIYPFWVPFTSARNGNAVEQKPPNSGKGYIELPYTLPQDSTMFLILRETTPAIWMRKLDWIAERGGMMLLVTHPDYMAFDGRKPSASEYPVKYYEDFLRYVRSRYDGAYCHLLPKQIAAYVRPQESTIRR